jgi:hypothetical protein
MGRTVGAKRWIADSRRAAPAIALSAGLGRAKKLWTKLHPERERSSSRLSSTNERRVTPAITMCKSISRRGGTVSQRNGKDSAAVAANRAQRQDGPLACSARRIMLEVSPGAALYDLELVKAAFQSAVKQRDPS